MRKTWVLGLTVFIFALGIRLLFNLQFQTPWSGDQPYLYRYALNVMDGMYYGTEGVYWPPGYIFFMGFLFKLIGQPDVPAIWSVKIVQSLCGALTATLLYSITTKMFRQRVIGFTAGLLYALLPAAILYTGMFLTETIWLMFVFLAVWLTFVSADKKRISIYVLTGLIYGLAALIRPNSLPLVILAGLYIYLKGEPQPFRLKLDWNRIKTNLLFPTIVMLITLIMTLIPWTVRNYIVVGEPVIFSVNPGINLYLAHNPKSTGMWIDMGPDDPVLKLGDKPEINREGKRQAYAYIAANKRETVKQFFQVNHWFWTLENKDIHDFGTRGLKWLYKIYSFKLLALFGVVGVFLSYKYWRSTLWIVLFMVAYNGLIAFLYYAPRYRFAIEPFLVPFAAFTIFVIGNWIWTKFKRGFQ